VTEAHQPARLSRYGRIRTMTLGSIRHHTFIRRPAAEVWELAGDPTRLHEWFPGITACEVDGNARVITLGSGLPMPEEILVKDDVHRRFQYRITAPVFKYHRGTIDVQSKIGKGTKFTITLPAVIPAPVPEWQQDVTDPAEMKS